MAVYQKLLLSAGGGIVSTQQQADQAKNTASVLIGLGGTGIDCLRTIKTQVYSRLKPDDTEAVTPIYSHIRFLGVDTTKKTQKDTEETSEIKADALIALEDTEFFSIANPDYKKAFTNPMPLKLRTESGWLREENFDIPDVGKAGTGGVRQVGRYMMMDKSELFLSRIWQEIMIARSGLRDSSVNIHIFSGLSGGTGAGCFLDVCYMIRSIADQVGGVSILGYFFLPDVNLSRIPFNDTKTISYIPKNGYASMRELDYCMQLQHNGGSFVQEYQGHRKIEWKTAPVDMCHLVSATDSAGDAFENAYDYAMNVTTEYVLDFLASSNGKLDLSQQLANFKQKVRAADEEKVIGSNLAYCAIGASCASIPLREINTYLAAALFDQFSSFTQNVPDKTDVEKFAIRTLAGNVQNVNKIYDSLYREVRHGIDGTYRKFSDDWESVSDYDNLELIAHYTNQTESMLNRVDMNCKSMLNSADHNSLVGRVRYYLDAIMCDINCGIVYAYRMISSGEGYSLLNIIDALIEENALRWNQKETQTFLKNKNYEDAKYDFDNRRKRRFFDNDKKRFIDYEYYLMLFEQHKLTMRIYAKVDYLLKEFRKQVVDIAGAYYSKLVRVMDTLVQTFKENRDALASGETMQNADPFSTPIMTIAELKNSLDAEIGQINVRGMLETFLLLLHDNQDEWIDEDENKISKLVTDFFIKTAFSGFANRTITSFIKDKYESENRELLADCIYQDWMKLLTAKAGPRLGFNSRIWREKQISKLTFLSIPSTSTPIKAAAEEMYQTNNCWTIKESTLTDRIYVMCSACAFPLCAYSNAEEYEHLYFSTTEIGRHYHEGKKVDVLVYDDWSKLPSLTPQSMFKSDSAPYALKNIVLEAGKLYDEAEAAGIFDDYNRICKLSEEDISSIKTKAQSCADLAIRISRPEELVKAKVALQELDCAMAVKLVGTEYAMPNDGFPNNAEIKQSVRKDYFVSAPAYHTYVAVILKDIKEVKEFAESARMKLTEKMDCIGQWCKDISDYCDAVFSGVISIDHRQVIYRHINHGIIKDYILSRGGPEFPYHSIPVYQGFLNYRALNADIKNAINKLANERLETDAPEAITIAEQLKDVISDDRMSAWAQLAAEYPNRIEIVDFLRMLKRYSSIGNEGRQEIYASTATG